MPQTTRALVKRELNGLYSPATATPVDLLVWTNMLRVSTGFFLK
jgi:hypothetical protein